MVWDIVQFARSQDIYCQIRGSGADSAVCRCLGLTRVDPIRLGLPFERFLSSERGRPPDIDVDFEAERREEVIQYCYQRYGRERAAMVANVITYRARSVLQDVGKAFGLTQAQVNGLTKYLDTRRPAEIDEHVDLPPGMTSDLILDACRRLDGFPRHLGIHSGGMVIADRPLWEVVPLEWGRMEDRSVLQWDKDDCASMGIVKFDLLGLGMLNALHLTVDLIEEVHGVRLDLADHPPGTGGLRDAHQGRHRGGVPGGVAGPDGDAAPDEAEDLLRPGHRGGADPPRPHPGALGAPLPAAPQRGGAGPLSPSQRRADPAPGPWGSRSSRSS